MPLRGSYTPSRLAWQCGRAAPDGDDARWTGEIGADRVVQTARVWGKVSAMNQWRTIPMNRLPLRWCVLVLSGVVWLTVLTARAGAEQNAEAGRVEGVLMIGGKPMPHQKVMLLRNDPPPFRTEGRKESPRVETDGDGRFVLENVEPGEWRVGLFKAYALRSGRTSTRLSTPSHAVAFHLKAGQTVEIQIGGTGRPVVGKLAPPKDKDVQPAFEGGSTRRVWSVTSRTRPPEDLAEADRAAWYKDYYRSEKGLAEWRSRRSYVVDVKRDGSFRIEDLPAGKYTGLIEVAKQGEEFGRASGAAHLSFTVPEMPGGRNAEPLDIGEVPVEFKPLANHRTRKNPNKAGR